MNHKPDPLPLHLTAPSSSSLPACLHPPRLPLQVLQHQARGLPLSGLAILYRTNMTAKPFTEALAAAGVPYKVVGSRELWDRMEVRDALAYLRLVANPGGGWGTGLL